ncbi:MAG: DUF4131 domain-containing protein, partial [Devosia sp.]
MCSIERHERKGGGRRVLRAETREREADGAPLPVPAPPRAALPSIRPSLGPTNPTARLTDVVIVRRLFVLLPSAMIAGLISYAALPMEPEPEALAAVGAALILLVALLWRSPALPLAGLLVAGWFGFCLLPLHGLWFGTAMLTRPAYGLYEGRVEEIVSATDESRRIIVSGLTPLADDRPVHLARARLVVPPQPPLAPGDVIRASIRLAPVPGPILPGAFDGQ